MFRMMYSKYLLTYLSIVYNIAWFNSFTLNNIIKKTFPEEYDERKLENESLTNPGGDFMPLFVMDVVLPCQKLHLNIFEPRYRLMVSWRWLFLIYKFICVGMPYTIVTLLFSITCSRCIHLIFYK